MARDISGIRERRRNKARSMGYNNEPSSEKIYSEQTYANLEEIYEPEIPITKLSRFARFKAFFKKIYRKKSKNEKLKQVYIQSCNIYIVL